MDKRCYGVLDRKIVQGVTFRTLPKGRGGLYLQERVSEDDRIGVETGT